MIAIAATPSRTRQLARPATPRPAQRGASLIELMVGVVIGLLAVLVIAQVALVYEGQKRTTTSGSDAQVNGALALQTLQRDVQMGGYGLTSGLSALGGTACKIFATFDGATAPNAPQLLAPVVIENGTNGVPDTLHVLSSGNAGFSLPIALGTDHATTDTVFVLKAGAAGTAPGVNVGNAQGDLMMAISTASTPPECTLFGINVDGMQPLVRDPGTGVETLGVALGTVAASTQLVEAAALPASAVAVSVGRRIGHTSSNTGAGRWNATPFSTAIYAADSTYLVNLGPPANFIYRSYGIVNNSLRLTSFSAVDASAPTQDLFPNIVSLQAVYGKAMGADAQQVTAWNNGDPNADVITNSSGVAVNGWSRVVAVRMVVVARSQQYEKTEVTPALPTWRPDGVQAEAIKIDTNADWKHYRYKIYETVVPLRNMIWQS